ncbi:MAG: GLPGLI family protein [Bacteroidia bacterium]|nr:GLPGLI family protein [Bacteroidia bacterium]
MTTKIKILLSTFFLLAAFLPAFSQQLILQGKVQYERKENIHKQFTEENEWTTEFKKQMPKYRTDQFELAFNSRKTHYKVTQEFESNSRMMDWFNVCKLNVVEQNLEQKKLHAIKTVYDKTYNLQDSLPQFSWKIHNEFRTIAGYSCRKASTIILDSVYVIAFYTDEIPVSAGPESFNGCPGMILGLVIPRLNCTWFATRIDHVSVSEEQLKMPPAKKGLVSFMQFLKEIKQATKDWGKESASIIWRSII